MPISRSIDEPFPAFLSYDQLAQLVEHRPEYSVVYIKIFKKKFKIDA